MKRLDILTRLRNSGVVAVIRADTMEEALKVTEAVVKGGMKGLEITFTIPQAENVIREIAASYKEFPEIVVGAGTVLDAYTARMAIMAGAEYIVSPCFNSETAEICNLYQIPYLPGCMTITEMKEALKAGVDIIKLFPGSAFGPSIVSSYKAPLPQLNIMPTGGVSLHNMEEWFKQGVIAVGVGGNLLAPAKTGEFEKITAMAREYMDKYGEIQSGK
ncbi:bifunctional 4-hydroxy-2-oxoglutarate aldolase/2-dehydro-3-deoxy-phosphogluconate aldolase [Niallia sp. JL1B1071]|uniref:bifunctional 4-hydroxy-2-oxoglutarate aldolase/2-dehydro-3-deoxy-phosphogluconate aldolase n=1 Tax=Niallia tiangongensis TaxID=3237105 RepID=UPI0037DD6FA5